MNRRTAGLIVLVGLIAAVTSLSARGEELTITNNSWLVPHTMYVALYYVGTTSVERAQGPFTIENGSSVTFDRVKVKAGFNRELRWSNNLKDLPASMGKPDWQGGYDEKAGINYNKYWTGGQYVGTREASAAAVAHGAWFDDAGGGNEMRKVNTECELNGFDTCKFLSYTNHYARNNNVESYFGDPKPYWFAVWPDVKSPNNVVKVTNSTGLTVYVTEYQKKTGGTAIAKIVTAAIPNGTTYSLTVSPMDLWYDRRYIIASTQKNLTKTVSDASWAVKPDAIEVPTVYYQHYLSNGKFYREVLSPLAPVTLVYKQDSKGNSYIGKQ